MVLENTISMSFSFESHFARPLSEFWYHFLSDHFPISFSFHITLCYFLPSIYRGECAEQNALGLRRRSLMVLEISMYFEKTPIGILVPFPYLIFFSHHTLLFFALYL